MKAPIAVLYRKWNKSREELHEAIIKGVDHARIEEFEIEGPNGPISAKDSKRWHTMIDEGNEQGFAVTYCVISNPEAYYLQED